MTIRYGFNYKGFKLACDPMPMANGNFGAQVVIYSDIGEETITRRYPALEYFSTEKDAVGHGHAVGKWIVDEELLADD